VHRKFPTKIHTQVDVVRKEVFEPCSGAFHKVEWQVLDDEEIIVSTCSTGEVKILYHKVGLVSLEYLVARGNTPGTTSAGSASRMLAGRKRSGSDRAKHLGSRGVDCAYSGCYRHSATTPFLPSPAQGVYHLESVGRCGLRQSGCVSGKVTTCVPLHPLQTMEWLVHGALWPFGGAARHGDMFDISLGVSSLHRALSLLYHRSF